MFSFPLLECWWPCTATFVSDASKMLWKANGFCAEDSIGWRDRVWALAISKILPDSSQIHPKSSQFFKNVPRVFPDLPRSSRIPLKLPTAVSQEFPRFPQNPKILPLFSQILSDFPRIQTGFPLRFPKSFPDSRRSSPTFSDFARSSKSSPDPTQASHVGIPRVSQVSLDALRS